MPARTLLVVLLAACTVPDGDLAASSAVLALDLTASTDTLAQRSTHITGTVELGFTSPDLVTLSIEDDGVPLYAVSLPADSLEVPVDAMIAPLSEGWNSLVARASYLDATATTALVVEVPGGVSDLVLTPPGVPDELAATISGTVTLGFDSADPALVEVWVEGALAATGELAGVAGPATFDLPVKLPHGGANDVVVVVTYGEGRRESSVTVGVAEPVVGFTVDLASPTTGTFDVAVTGQVDVGYRSERPATFEVLADGVLVHSELLDVSATTSVPVAAVIPLAHVGASAVLARLRYEGREASETESVSVEPEAPDVTLPTWTIDYVPSTSLTAAGSILASPPADWVVESVRGSMDGGLTWTDASAIGAAWRQEFLNPDLEQPVVIEVETSNRGIPLRWRFDDVLPVDLIFDCLDGGSMQPSNDLLRDMGTEYRTMVGYFGSPTSPHSVAFVILADTESAGAFPEVGATIQRGSFAIDVSYNVDEYRCGGGCFQNYELEVLFDGASFCVDPSFGRITERP